MLIFGLISPMVCYTCDVSSLEWNEIPERVSRSDNVVWNWDRSSSPNGEFGMMNAPSVSGGEEEGVWSLLSLSARMTLYRCVGTATLLGPMT